ncbi:hypothetical protein RIVM261_036020 [Rivularia sp. IAM M-261]|nr:hypothetical protein CAL7716_074880 [Calothrix sp. PCC 7716]GJD18646.1 hypothetical protein RIVM261_036020 [Rivularia sp. IAM M-261]
MNLEGLNHKEHKEKKISYISTVLKREFFSYKIHKPLPIRSQYFPVYEHVYNNKSQKSIR